MTTEIIKWSRIAELRLHNCPTILALITRPTFVSTIRVKILQNRKFQGLINGPRPRVDKLIVFIDTWITSETDFERFVCEKISDTFVLSDEYPRFSLWCSYTVLNEIVRQSVMGEKGE